MISKSILLIFGCILFLQGYNAAPYKDMDSAVRGLGEHLKLLKLVHTELNVITAKVLRDCYDVVKKMLKDPKILGINSPLMQSNLDEIRNFLKTFEEFEKNGEFTKKEIRELMGEYDIIATKYGEEKQILEAEEDKMIATFLKENGFVRFGEATQALARTLTDDFQTEAQIFLDGLNETQKKDESGLVDLIDELKVETNVKRRGNLVMTYFDSVDLETFLWHNFEKIH